MLEYWNDGPPCCDGEAGTKRSIFGVNKTDVFTLFPCLPGLGQGIMGCGKKGLWVNRSRVYSGLPYLGFLVQDVKTIYIGFILLYIGMEGLGVVCTCDINNAVWDCGD